MTADLTRETKNAVRPFKAFDLKLADAGRSIT